MREFKLYISMALPHHKLKDCRNRCGGCLCEQGRMQEAIDNYHKALSLRPEDTFTAEMLTAAVEECADIELAF